MILHVSISLLWPSIQSCVEINAIVSQIFSRGWGGWWPAGIISDLCTTLSFLLHLINGFAHQIYPTWCSKFNPNLTMDLNMRKIHLLSAIAQKGEGPLSLSSSWEIDSAILDYTSFFTWEWMNHLGPRFGGCIVKSKFCCYTLLLY